MGARAGSRRGEERGDALEGALPALDRAPRFRVGRQSPKDELGLLLVLGELALVLRACGIGESRSGGWRGKERGGQRLCGAACRVLCRPPLRSVRRRRARRPERPCTAAADKQGAGLLETTSAHALCRRAGGPPARDESSRPCCTPLALPVPRATSSSPPHSAIAPPRSSGGRTQRRGPRRTCSSSSLLAASGRPAWRGPRVSERARVATRR